MLELGWWTHWHCGYDPNDGIGPGHALYGMNLLAMDQPKRDPRAKPYRVQHPPEGEYRAARIRDYEQRTGRKVAMSDDQDPRTGLLLPPDDE